MNGIQFEISARILNTLQGHAAKKDDPRYYLHGVHIVVEQYLIRLEATDGYKLLRWTLVNPAQTGIGLNVIVKLPKLSAKETITLTIVGETVTLRHYGTTITAEVLEGTYPDTNRAIPQQPDGTPAAFDPDILAAAGKAIAELAKAEGFRHSRLAPARLVMNGPNAALMACSALPRMTYVLMPTRER